MTKKLFNGLKNSVGEIIDDYKKKRADVATEEHSSDEGTKEKSKKK